MVCCGWDVGGICSRKSIRKMEELSVPLIIRTMLGLAREDSEDLEDLQDVSQAVRQCRERRGE